MKTCPNCNSSVNDTAKFCKKCGFNIKKYEEQNANIIVFCEECGAKIPSDSVFCEECGFQIITTDNESNSGFDFGGIGDISDSATEQLYHRNGLKVENGVLVEYTGKKRTITIPGTIEEIFDKVFENNDFITKVVIEEGVRVIGKRAFAKCTSLKEITIPSSCSFKEIYKGAFDGTDIEMLILPKQNDEIISLFISKNLKKHLTDEEINGCIKKGKGSITYDIKSMKNLAEKAKRKAEEAKRKKEEEKRKAEEAKRKKEEEAKRKAEEELEELRKSIDQNGVLGKYYGNATSIVIPYGVKAIGEKAFENCSNLTSVEIPSSVTSIGDSAFWNCTKLTSIKIPSSVTSIGRSAFFYCTNLTSIEIPNGVKEIEISAFSNCTNLTSIEIPSSVTKIGSSIFERCSNLTDVSISTMNDNYTSIGGAIYSKDMKTLVEYLCSNKTTNFRVPYGVKAIRENAFDGCSNLTSVEIPSSVTSIGRSAFSLCTNLKSVKIPYGVTEISSFTFSYCENLTSIEIPSSVEKIGNHAFWKCEKLKSIRIPSGCRCDEKWKGNCPAYVYYY